MYIYIDESGNFGWPLKSGSEPYMLFCVLVIDGLRAKKAISQAVSRAIVDLRKHHPSCRDDPERRILELKGNKLLCDRPDVRLRLFKRIVKKANFHIYSIVLDKRVLKQKLPEDYMERYSMLLLNILCAIQIPENQKWVTMVVDSQARAEPTQPVKVRYSSKAKRLRQKRARHQDRNRFNKYNQMITSVFKGFLKPKGTHLKVWHCRSENDYCLQAVDVIVHFMYQKLRMDEERQKLFQNIPSKERGPIKLANNSQWQRIKSASDRWYEAHKVLKPRIEWINRPEFLRRRRMYKPVVYSRRYSRKKRWGNREA